MDNTVEVPLDGAITFWTLSGPVSQSDLSDLMPESLKGVVPEPLSSFAALKSVLEDVYRKEKLLVRPLATKAGFAVVKENKGTDENDYQNMKWVKIGAPLVFSGDSLENSTIQEMYTQRRISLEPAQVGAMLARVVGVLNGVALRPSGGFYYVPAKSLGMWTEVTDVVSRISSHSIFRLSHRMDEDGLRAISVAAMEDARNRLDKIQAAISYEGSRESTKEANVLEARAVFYKVREYETILGTTLPILAEYKQLAEQAAVEHQLIRDFT